jgi:hypothetical protein
MRLLASYIAIPSPNLLLLQPGVQAASFGLYLNFSFPKGRRCLLLSRRNPQNTTSLTVLRRGPPPAGPGGGGGGAGPGGGGLNKFSGQRAERTGIWGR